jgi:hypothetical protein
MDQRMNTMIKVARYHLVRPVLFVALPWATLAFTLAVNVARGVNHRWGTLGLLAFIAVQVLIALAVTFAYSWSGAGGHLPGLSALDLTGVIAALTVVFLAGGHATIRRVTV